MSGNRALRAAAFPAVLVLLAFAGCDAADSAKTAATPGIDAAQARRVLSHYADFAHASYADAAAAAEELNRRILEFLAEPSEDSLRLARRTWMEARPWYQHTEVMRFYGGPIDADPGGPEVFVNSWPVDEVWIDTWPDSAEGGIVNLPERHPVIDAESLRALNMFEGEENVATGWHAIEYLLWGVDRSETGPGDRAHGDFVDGQAPNAERRRRYLAVVAEMLVRDLESVRDAWAPEGGVYRAEFLAREPEEALAMVFTGLGTLMVGELRGERLVVPFQTKMQEDEHSCFSDTTHRDHLHDALGAEAVWTGSYASRKGDRDLRGEGLRTLAAAADPERAAALDRALSEVIRALKAPALVPFDRAITGADDSEGRRALEAAIAALATFDRALGRVAEALGLDIMTRLPS